MEEKVSQYVFESELARMERHIKRWFIGWIITFTALVLSNLGWLYYEHQFQDVVIEQETQSDGDGDVTVNGVGVGDLNYGNESETDNKTTDS
jgi:hypothetical protein